MYLFSDAHNTFNLFDKKGNGQVSTKDLGNIFKSLALQVGADKLKDWADEVDEDGIYYLFSCILTFLIHSLVSFKVYRARFTGIIAPFIRVWKEPFEFLRVMG